MSRKLFIACLIILLSACAPRVAVKPIPPETTPSEVLKMAAGKLQGLNGLKASVKVTVQVKDRNPQTFDGVLYLKRPDSVRLTGLALMGFTVFDVVLTGEKFYFYQPSDGYLYTGRRAALAGFLKGRGVDVDPEDIGRALFLDEAAEAKYRYFVEKTPEGYEIYSLSAKDSLMTPVLKSVYDPGLELMEEIFYDDSGKPYLSVQPTDMKDVGGFRLPGMIKATDTRSGYAVTVDFEKYLVNPEGIESDFTIQGGELKGIREVE